MIDKSFYSHCKQCQVLYQIEVNHSFCPACQKEQEWSHLSFPQRIMKRTLDRLKCNHELGPLNMADWKCLKCGWIQ